MAAMCNLVWKHTITYKIMQLSQPFQAVPNMPLNFIPEKWQVKRICTHEVSSAQK